MTKKVYHKCYQCEHKFLAYKSSKRKFCSPQCYFLSLKGRKLSLKHRKKIGIGQKGRTSPMLGKKHSKKARKKISKGNLGKFVSKKIGRKISKSNKGRIFTKGHKEKLSISHKGQVAWNKGKVYPQFSGKNSGTWLGGISFEPYTPEFNNALKDKIRKRDHYRCQQCFRHQDELYTKSGRKYKLHIHHIDYNKKNCKESNLISLCRNCHVQTNYSREDWTKYFLNKRRSI